MLKIIALSLLFAFSISSVNADDEMADPLAGIEINSDEIQKSLANMKANGQISAEDFEKASKQLSTMSSTEIKTLNQAAIGMVRNDPDKAVELTKAKSINSAEVEKQVQALSRPAVD